MSYIDVSKDPKGYHVLEAFLMKRTERLVVGLSRGAYSSSRIMRSPTSLSGYARSSGFAVRCVLKDHLQKVADMRLP
jgi:hypothetical protein